MKENLHFIFGTDEFFVELKTKKLLDPFSQHSLEVIDGMANTLADCKQVLSKVIEALQTVDFFSSQKCVWLRGTNLFATGSPALTEGGQSTVEHFLSAVERTPEGVHLFLSASPVDKRTRFFKAMQALCTCEELEEKQSETYRKFLIQKLCKEWHMTIEPDACELLFQKLNRQPRAIANEWEKLACAKQGTGCITLQDVKTYTPTWLNDEFFEPVEAFYEKDEARYLRSLRNHFTLHKEMRTVCTLFQNRNRLLIQLASLRLPSVSKVNLEKKYSMYAENFGSINDKNTFCVFSQNPWYLSRLKSPFPLSTLLEIQQALVEVFDQLLQYPKQAYAWMGNFVRFF